MSQPLTMQRKAPFPQASARMIFLRFGLGLVLLGIVAAAAVRTIASLVETSQHVENANLSIRTIQDALQETLNIETGSRGYVLTGREEFLAPFQDARPRLRMTLERLAHLWGQSPPRRRQFERLQGLIEARVRNAENMVAARRSGTILEDQQARLATGKLVTDQIRQLTGEMEAEALRELRQHHERQASEVRSTKLTIAGALLVGFLVIPLAGFLTTQEIRRRTAAERALRESQVKLQAVMDHAPAMIYVMDLEGRYQMVNLEWERVTGKPQSQVLGKTLFQVLDGRQAEIFWANDLRVLEAGRAMEFEESGGAGSSRTFLSIKFPLKDASGEAYGLCGISTDITERKQVVHDLDKSREELREQREILQSVLDSMGDGVIVADEMGRFLLFNPAATMLLGQGALNEPPERWSEKYGAFYPDGKTLFLTKDLPLVRAINGENVDAVEMIIRGPNAADRWISINGRPLSSGKRGRGGGVVVFRDITSAKETERSLQAAKEAAERANRLKDQFLSSMNHELRTPLNAILGFAQILQDERQGALSASQRKFLNNIYESGKHLLSLINDILDLSKIEAGRMELQFETVPVSILLAEVTDALRVLAQKKSQRLSIESEPELFVRGDRRRLSQVLLNLAGNAIKFTPEGGSIEIRARARIPDAVRFEVRDSGPGISLENQKLIFQSFHRVKAEGSPEGTGLGLPISQRLVALHGGDLQVQSTLGHGSCFSFDLPCVQAMRLHTMTTRRRVSNGAPRVLIIEDDPIAASLIEAHLRAAGMKTEVCLKPDKALALAEKLEPQAITLDLLMPPPDGWHLLSELKRNPRTAAIPVVILSIVDQLEAGLTLGAREYLVKPIESRLLVEAVSRCLGSSASGAKTVLVVEDDAATRSLLVSALSEHGYTVLSAGDGMEARTVVARMQPSLVILDLVLPGVSGVELLVEWRSNPRTADLSVVVLTGKDLSEEERQFLSGSASMVVSKGSPWRETLVDEIHRVVNERTPPHP